jgi:hypothetical protein
MRGDGKWRRGRFLGFFAAFKDLVASIGYPFGRTQVLNFPFTPKVPIKKAFFPQENEFVKYSLYSDLKGLHVFFGCQFE